ncbi:hypothetical protein LAZ67_19002460 [Cordylochernes scorpioides]|uniref:Calponin-homology (CH) domain-containing protein n=1 Tax=Cordylochernes scorpioides TaxID=51811 RepID=A0ABY6LII9_9ARAC|nr:hypothetical protein LAZ67_19002460 [Cordylochernes scorpioides]
MVSNVFALIGTTPRVVHWLSPSSDSCDSASNKTLGETFGQQEEEMKKAEIILKTRVQKASESSESYIQDVLYLCQFANPLMDEETKLGHLMKGIAEDIYQILIAKDVEKVDQFLKECRKIESMKIRRITTRKFERLSNVALVAYEEEDIPSLIRMIVQEEINKVKIFPPASGMQKHAHCCNHIQSLAKEKYLDTGLDSVLGKITPQTSRALSSSHLKRFLYRWHSATAKGLNFLLYIAGTYRVNRQLSEVTYEVDPLEKRPRQRKTKDSVHVQRIKLYWNPEDQIQDREKNKEIGERGGKPLIRETFTIIGRAPDLQDWVFRHGLDDDALAILVSDKTRIYGYFLGAELRSVQEDLVWRRTLSRYQSKVGERGVDSSCPRCHVAGTKNNIPVWGKTESGDICGKEKTWRLAYGRVDDLAWRCQESLTSEWSTSRCRGGMEAVVGLRALSAEGRAMNGGSTEVWVEIQQKTFTNWVNEQLRPVSMNVSDLRHDFCDGIKLVALIEILQKRKLKTIRKPINQHQYLENVQTALNAMTADNIKLVNIAATMGPCQFSVVVVVSYEEPQMSPYISITAAVMSTILDV